MKLFHFIFKNIIPIGLLTGAGLFVFNAAVPVTSSRMEGIGVDLLSSPPLSQQLVDAQLNAIQQAGAEYVRIEVNWTLIESSADVYDWSNVMPLDYFFSSAKTRGLKSVAVVTGFPVYLTGVPDQQTVGARWEKFIQATVDHFGSEVSIWQIGDQINSSVGSRSLAQGDPAFYTNMLRSASKIIKRADANNQVWLGSLVSATASTCVMNPLTFLLEINGGKGWNSADVITYQPERGAVAPENPAVAVVNPKCGSSMAADSISLTSEVQAVQDLARQLGGKPVNITGLVWSPEDLTPLSKDRLIDVNTLQSDLLVRGSIMMMSGNAIPLVFWQVDPISQLPSMNSLRNLDSVLVQSKALGQTQGASGSVQEYRFQKGAEISAFTWRTRDGDNPQPVSYSGLAAGTMTAFAADAVSLESSTGTPVKVDDAGNTMIMVNERPVILTGKTGGLDAQIKAGVSDQLDMWKDDIHNSISGFINDQKTALVNWIGSLFVQAKDSAVDWGSDQINGLLN
jgi:hypothetical protein